MPGDDTSGSDDRRMPRWVPRAVIYFWLGALGALVARHLFNRLSSLLILLLLSLFVALAIEPGVMKLEHTRLGRRGATGLIMVLLLISVGTFVGAVGTLVGQQTADLLSNSETYVNDTVKFLNDTFGTNIDPESVNERIRDPNGAVQKFINDQQGNALRLSVQGLTMLLQLFSLVLFSYYLVADGPRMRRAICSRLTPDKQQTVLEVWDVAVKKTGGFLYSRALLAVLSGTVHWIVFQIIGTPAPIALALWVGLVSQFIPVIGTYLAGVLPLLLAFLESPLDALVVLIVILVYQQVENYVFAPKITERTLDLHPALAFGGALAGAAALGVVGALIALPFVAMVQALVSTWGERHPVVEGPLTTLPVAPTRRMRKKQ
ncbi:MAG: AI-2E family transporter [Ilumatobacteraceae bacterium]